MKRTAEASGRNVVLGLVLSVLVVTVVAAFSILSHSPSSPSPDNAVRSFVDAANGHDTALMLNFTMFKFESAENFTKEDGALAGIPWLDDLSFTLMNVGIVEENKMSDIDKTVAMYDIQSKKNAFNIEIISYCKAFCNITSICQNPSYFPIVEQSKALSLNIYCYKVGSSWYFSDLPDILV